jgi:hypothetical protein
MLAVGSTNACRNAFFGSRRITSGSLNAEVASSNTGNLPCPPGSLRGRTCGGNRDISSGVTDMPPVRGWTFLAESTGMSVPGRTPSWFAAEPHDGRPLWPLSIARNIRTGIAISGSLTSDSLSRAWMLVHLRIAPHRSALLWQAPRIKHPQHPYSDCALSWP